MNKVELGQTLYLRNPDSRVNHRDGEKKVTKITPKFFILDDEIRCRRVDQEPRKDGVVAIEVVGMGSSGNVYLTKEDFEDRQKWKKFKINISSVDYTEICSGARKNIVGLFESQEKGLRILEESEIQEIMNELLVNKKLDAQLMKEWTNFVLKATTKGISEAEMMELPFMS